MRYLIYTRVSTGKQDTETQIRLCLEYLKSKHFNTTYAYEIFDEGDLTSTLPMHKRPQLVKMLDSVTKDDIILVYELDRLARDVLEQVMIYRVITRQKMASLHSLNDNCDELTITIMGAIAQKQRERTQAKTKEKLNTKRLKGERYSRHLPYGYKMHETHKVPIRVGNEIVYKLGVLVRCPEEEKALQLMQECLDMGMSYGTIANYINDQGYKNRLGNPWHKSSVHHLLSKKAKDMSKDLTLAVR